MQLKSYIQLCLRASAVLWKSKTITRISRLHLWCSLIRACRPHTSVFAFVLTVVSFKLLALPWMPAVFIGAGFAGITLSIMLWNDFVDRHRDVEKGKIFALRHPWCVLSAWRCISSITLAILALSAVFWWQAVLLCGTVWILGLLYSVIRLGYPLNNLLVALCSGSPVLAGMAYAETFDTRILLVYCIVFSTIMMTETVKDIQDAKGDVGYKSTLATKAGRLQATVMVVMLCYLPVSFALFYPHWVIKTIAISFAAVAFSLGISFTRPRALCWARSGADFFLTTLLIVLLIV